MRVSRMSSRMIVRELVRELMRGDADNEELDKIRPEKVCQTPSLVHSAWLLSQPRAPHNSPNRRTTHLPDEDDDDPVDAEPLSHDHHAREVHSPPRRRRV